MGEGSKKRRGRNAQRAAKAGEESIGIDDAMAPGSLPDVTQRAEMARRFMTAFADTYRALHRNAAAKGAPLTPQGRALLLHLEWSGPMTIGDLARHCERAQSVVSETCDVLTSHGMIEKVRDPRDKRRTLVWLSSAAQTYLAEEREPLDRARVEAALSAMNTKQVSELLRLYETFVVFAKHLDPEERNRT
jgi:DNA-binding MarR family transcriptional regulator